MPVLFSRVASKGMRRQTWQCSDTWLCLLWVVGGHQASAINDNIVNSLLVTRRFQKAKVCFKDTNHVEKYFKGKKGRSWEIFLTHCDKMISSLCFTLCLPYTLQHSWIKRHLSTFSLLILSFDHLPRCS